MRSLPWFVSSLILLAGIKPLEAQKTVDETAALRSDTQWLHLIDSSSYNDAWKSAAKVMQDAVPESNFEKAIRGARTPLGALNSRTLNNVETTTHLPGAPDGLYVVAKYSAHFTNKADGIETIVASREPDGSWRVSGYFIR